MVNRVVPVILPAFWWMNCETYGKHMQALHVFEDSQAGQNSPPNPDPSKRERRPGDSRLADHFYTPLHCHRSHLRGGT